MPRKKADELLAIEYRDIGSLRPNPQNTNKHPPEQILAGKIILLHFPFQTPLVITPDGLIVKGNGIFTSAAALFAEGHDRFARLPCIVTHLKGAELEAYGTADNRLGDFSTWDARALAEAEARVREAGLPIAAMGFDEESLRRATSAVEEETQAALSLLPALVATSSPPSEPPPPVSADSSLAVVPPMMALGGGGGRRLAREPDARPQPIASANFQQERPIVLYYGIADFEAASKILDDVRARSGHKDNGVAILALLRAWRRDPNLFDLAGAAP